MKLPDNNSLLIMSEALEKQILSRIKRVKCEQRNCSSNGQETLEIAVFNGQFEKSGIMCTSCFIDQQLIQQLGNVEHHALSVQKFMKVLTKQYAAYAQQKTKPEWPPNMVDEERLIIKKKIISLSKQVEKGIMEIMKYMDDASKQAFERARKVNHDPNFEKLFELITEEDQQEQERINVNNQIKNLVGKLELEQGQFKFAGEQEIKRENQIIMTEYKVKIAKAKDAILKMTEVLKRCIKYLVE